MLNEIKPPPVTPPSLDLTPEPPATGEIPLGPVILPAEGSTVTPARFVPHAEVPPGVASTHGHTLPTPGRPLHGGALRTPAPHGARGEGEGGVNGAGGVMKLGRAPLRGEPTKTDVIYSLPEERGSNFSIYFSIIVILAVTLTLFFVFVLPLFR